MQWYSHINTHIYICFHPVTLTVWHGFIKARVCVCVCVHACVRVCVFSFFCHLSFDFPCRMAHPSSADWAFQQNPEINAAPEPPGLTGWPARVALLNKQMDQFQDRGAFQPTCFPGAKFRTKCPAGFIAGKLVRRRQEWARVVGWLKTIWLVLIEGLGIYLASLLGLGDEWRWLEIRLCWRKDALTDLGAVSGRLFCIIQTEAQLDVVQSRFATFVCHLLFLLSLLL